MFRKARHRITLLTIITLLFLGGALQPQHVAALAGQVMLADTNESWNTGRFFRTGLASAQIGGVQLVPVNVLKTWSTTSSLPRALSSHTSTMYRDHLFVMGGNTLTNDTLVKTPSFFVTRLNDRVYGQLRPWTDYTATQPLPEPLSDMASVVVEVNNAVYLYVLGGQLSAGTTVNGVSSNTVYVNRLVPDATGRLIPQGWQLIPEDSALGLPLPHPTNPGSMFERGGGALGMSVVTVELGGVPYIYIFGGNNRRFFSGSGYTSEGDGTQSAVYRTAVNADGTLVGWTKMSDIQEILDGREATTVGLTGAAGVTFTEPLDNRTGVYLIGGSRKSGRVSVDDAQVYVARFENDGSLEWLPTGSMSESRAGHDAVQANGRIQVAGGTQDRSQTPSLPKTSMALGLINDDLSLYLPTEGTTNFELIEGALINARMNHTFETLNAGINGDWAYVIGGQRQLTNGALERATDQVVLGNLSEPPTPGDSYVRDAKYYSQIFDFGAEATYSSLEWTTLLGAGQKISIQYRASDNREVLGPLSNSLNSVNGDNAITFPKIKGRYFQFVATLEASTINRQATPILSSMSLGLDRAGFPNLRVASDSVYMTDDGAPSNPSNFTRILDAITIAPRVTVTNKAYVNPITKLQHPVFDANFQGNGGFFVDIFVRPPDRPDGPPHMGETGVAWKEVRKEHLPANASVQITPEQWNPASCMSEPCPAVNWQAIFPQDGIYTVYIMVDSTDSASTFPVGQVQETDSPIANTLGERDNLYGPLTVAIGEEPPTPTATKPTSPTRTPMPSPTRTTTRTPGNAATATAQSRTATAQSGTATATQTPGNAATATAQSHTATAQSGTATAQSQTATRTPGNAATATAQSGTATRTPTPSPTRTATRTPGNAATATAQSRTATAQSGTATRTATAQSGTATRTPDATPTVTRTPGNAATATAQSHTATAQSGTATRTPVQSPTPIGSRDNRIFLPSIQR